MDEVDNLGRRVVRSGSADDRRRDEVDGVSIAYQPTRQKEVVDICRRSLQMMRDH